MSILTSALAGALAWRQRLLGARASGPAGSVLTTVSMSPTLALVQMRAVASANSDALEWKLVATRRADPGVPALAELKRWQREGLLPRQGAVLVLGGADRHLQTLDRPAVPEAELMLAVRWPLAESMEAEPEDLLVTALPLTPVNEGGRLQVLAVAGRTAAVKAHLALLAQAGAKVTCIDVVESALRGLAVAHARPDHGSIVLLTLGSELAVGLLWKGEICALRSIALPALEERESPAWVDQLALQVQRTADHYERQATQFAVREVLACLPDLSPPERAALCGAIALPTREVQATNVDASDADATAIPTGGDESGGTLAALVGVAVARLAGQRAPQDPATRPEASGAAARPSPAEAAAAVLAQAAMPPAGRAAEPSTAPAKPMEWTQ